VADLDERNDGDDAQDQAALAIVARHALHDEELIAAYAAGGLDDDAEADADRERARSLVDRCPACRDLHRDLEAIGSALRVAATTAVAVAPRDFRLTADDARRLGGPVAVRAVVTSVRRSIWSFARPLGATFASLGVVGLLFGTLSLGGLSTPGSMAVDMPSPDPGSEIGPAATPAAVGGSFRTSATGPAPTREEVVPPGSVSGLDAGGPIASTWLLLGSAGLLIAGVVLILLGARRAGPPRLP
jgi:hypothetical protein